MIKTIISLSSCLVIVFFSSLLTSCDSNHKVADTIKTDTNNIFMNPKNMEFKIDPQTK